MQELLGIFIGLGLSATCGFRVFVPLLGINLAHHAGELTLAPGFDWLGSWPATVAFSIALVIEVAGYYIPWVDNLLDTIATPAAVVAGTIATASVVGDVSPFLRWSLAIIAGGGIAGLIQGSSVVVRGTSTASTAGLANPIVSTTELGASIVGTLVSLLLPVVAFVLVILLLTLIMRWYARRNPRAG
ncbi:MAG: DUF4126 domain-containing protein [Anaerolineales bacterium]